MVSQDGPQVTRQVNGADQGALDLTILEQSHGGFQGTDAGTLFVGEGEAWPAHAEFPGDAAGHHAAQGAHGPVGGECRSGGIAQLTGPGRQFLR